MQGYPSRTSSGEAFSEQAARSLSVVFVLVTICSAVLFYFLVTHGTWKPEFQQDQAGFGGDFYLAQAFAMLHGTFAVTPAQLPDECWVVHRSCIGYFGITPSLIRMPFLPLLDAIKDALDPVFMTAAVTLAVGSALAVLRRLLRRTSGASSRWYVAIPAAIALGPGSVLITLARPAVYEEAIVWAVGFLCLSTYCLMRWWSALDRRWAVLLTASLVLGSCARPTALAASGVMGIAAGVRIFSSSDSARRTPRSLATVGVIGGLPIIAGLGVFTLKFGTPFPSLLLNQQVGGPSADPNWIALRKANHGQLQGFRFVPTALLAYLRPDTLVFTHQFPYVNYRFPTFAMIKMLGLQPGSMYEAPVSSITDAMPLAIVLGLFGLCQGLRSMVTSRFQFIMVALRAPTAWCALALGAAWYVTLSSVGLTNRYLGDVYPLVALGLSYGTARLVESLSKTSRAWNYLLVAMMSLVAVASIGVNLALTYQGWWHTIP